MQHQYCCGGDTDAGAPVPQAPALIGLLGAEHDNSPNCQIGIKPMVTQRSELEVSLAKAEAALAHAAMITGKASPYLIETNPFSTRHAPTAVGRVPLYSN